MPQKSEARDVRARVHADLHHAPGGGPVQPAHDLYSDIYRLLTGYFGFERGGNDARADGFCQYEDVPRERAIVEHL